MPGASLDTQQLEPLVREAQQGWAGVSPEHLPGPGPGLLRLPHGSPAAGPVRSQSLITHLGSSPQPHRPCSVMTPPQSPFLMCNMGTTNLSSSRPSGPLASCLHREFDDWLEAWYSDYRNLTQCRRGTPTWLCPVSWWPKRPAESHSQRRWCQAIFGKGTMGMGGALRSRVGWCLPLHSMILPLLLASNHELTHRGQRDENPSEVAGCV